MFGQFFLRLVHFGRRQRSVRSVGGYIFVGSFIAKAARQNPKAARRGARWAAALAPPLRTPRLAEPPLPTQTSHMRQNRLISLLPSRQKLVHAYKYAERAELLATRSPGDGYNYCGRVKISGGHLLPGAGFRIPTLSRSPPNLARGTKAPTPWEERVLNGARSGS